MLEGQDPNDDLLAAAKSIALRARAEVTGEWGEYIGHLEDRYSSSKDPSLLLSICTTLASQKLWAGVAEHATELVEQIPTPSALGLSATAAYNVGEFETSLLMHFGFPVDLSGTDDRDAVKVCNEWVAGDLAGSGKVSWSTW